MLKIVKKVFLRLVPLLFLLFIFGGYFYFKGHVDLSPLCKINIEGHIYGDSNSIRKAIWMMKDENYEAYKYMCENIDTIIEGNCYAGDGVYSKDWIADWPGCYIKKSDVLYLKPATKNPVKLTETRKDALIHLMDVVKENK